MARAPTHHVWIGVLALFILALILIPALQDVLGLAATGTPAYPGAEQEFLTMAGAAITKPPMSSPDISAQAAGYLVHAAPARVAAWYAARMAADGWRQERAVACDSPAVPVSAGLYTSTDTGPAGSRDRIVVAVAPLSAGWIAGPGADAGPQGLAAGTDLVVVRYRTTRTGMNVAWFDGLGAFWPGPRCQGQAPPAPLTR